MAVLGTRQFSALRQMAAFGLPGRSIMAEVMQCLDGVVGFESSSMVYLDSKLEPNDVYVSCDVKPEVSSRYQDRWFNQDETQFYPSQSRMQTDPRFSIIRVSDFTSRLGRTEIYDEIFKHDRHHWIAGVAIRDGTKALGNLGIGRPPSSGDFSDGEMKLLAQARPFVTQALTRWDDASDFTAEQRTATETAVVVADMAGNLQHMTANGWRLLRQAAGVASNREMLNDGTYSWARPFLVGLARRVEAALLGRETAPATMTVKSPYGYFILRAYALDAAVKDSMRSISVQIERHVPIALQLLTSSNYRTLSLRERKVCELLVLGLSHAAVASAIGVKQSTAISHARSLYAKLGVHDRQGLADTLLPPQRHA